jgi:hypothetical protein
LRYSKFIGGSEHDFSKAKEKQNALVRLHRLRENRPDHISGSVPWSSGITQRSTSPAKRYVFGSLLGCKFYEGREVVFNAWRLEETKPLKQRETLAVRSRIYIYSKLEKANKKRNATNIC